MSWAKSRLEDHMKTLSYIAVTALAALLLTTTAVAGSAPHRMPAGYTATQSSYELKITGVAETGKPLVVSLVDPATGQAVPGGGVAVMRAVFRGNKAVPSIQWVAESLPRNADGKFVCAPEHHAEGVILRGVGPSGTSPVWLNVPVHS
jgi:hypothetical protein